MLFFGVFFALTVIAQYNNIVIFVLFLLKTLLKITKKENTS